LLLQKLKDLKTLTAAQYIIYTKCLTELTAFSDRQMSNVKCQKHL